MVTLCKCVCVKNLKYDLLFIVKLKELLKKC